MKFPGYWVENADGKVVIRTTTFDETELDPQTDWKEAWQNQDANSSVKGFVETGKALAHAARLIARNKKREISDVEIFSLQSAPSLFKDGIFELNTLEDLQLLYLLINSMDGIHPAQSKEASI